MRPSLRLLLAAALTAPPALAQTPVRITAADLPVAGDSLRLSLAAALPAGAPALTQRGPNQTWNYAGLQPAAQRVERYGTVAALASGLQLLVFGPVGGVNRATLASPLDAGAGVPGPNLPLSDGREFFNLSAGDFRSVGFGVSLAGTALPVPYASQAQQDVVYRLPQAFGNAPDVSRSFFTLTVPGAGTLSRRRQRRNQTDAWGTLTTPFGTFQTLRVVTTLDDTVSLSSGPPTGPGVPLPTQQQYKWLTPGGRVPVLTITTTLGPGGTERVSGIEYRDRYRRLVPLSTAAAAGAARAAGYGLYPSPSAAGQALRLTVPAGTGPLRLSGRDPLGRELFARTLTPGGAPEVVLEAATLGPYRGLLLLTVQPGPAAAPVVLRTVRE